MKSYDVIVVGGGPSGSVTASYLARGGARVAIIERERYPRFHIGESLLPASMPLYKEIGFFEKLSSGKYIQKNGARFIDYSNDDEIYFGFNEGFNPDIPMAYEVERCDFDQDLLEHAKSLGAEVFQPERAKEFFEEATRVRLITTNHEFEAKYLIDTTGRDAFLGKKQGSRFAHKDLNNFAVFSHYIGVERYPGQHEGDITIGLLPNRSWSWIIPFKGEKTSVGIVASSVNVASGVDLSQHLDRELTKSPRVKRMMQNAERSMEVTSIANYSQGCRQFFGERWLMAGDAAAFLDPIFSSGVHVASQSGKFAALTVLEALRTERSLSQEHLGPTYELLVRKGVDRFKNLILLFYNNNFVGQMKQTLQRENMRKGFTSAVAGDMWNDDNFLFSKSIL